MVTDKWEIMHIVLTVSVAIDVRFEVLGVANISRGLASVLAVTRVLRLLRPLLVVRRVPFIATAIDALWCARVGAAG